MSWSENQFRRPHGGSKTPHELLTGQTRTKPPCCLLASLCFCEVPDSFQSPAGSRWVIGSFLGGVHGEQGLRAASYAATSSGLELKVFTARSIRPMNRVLFDLKMSDFILIALEEQFKPEVPGPVRAVPIPAKMGTSGPPASWLRENGRTPNCNACAQPTFGKKVHNAHCKKRYQDWLKNQRELGDLHRQSVDPVFPEPEVSDHPTGGRRARIDWEAKTGKETAEKPISNRVENDGSSDAIPEASRDIEMEEDYEPSLPGDVPMLHEPELMPQNSEKTENEDVEMKSDVFQSCREFTERWCEEYEVEQSRCGFCKRSMLAPLWIPKTGQKLKTKPFWLCGEKIYLVEPEKVISEDGTRELDVKLTMDGRETELKALDAVKFGRLLKEDATKRLKLKIIPSRWVVGAKDIQVSESSVDENYEGVRARLVVQEVASGSGSAGKMGFSSNTPSTESVRLILGRSSDPRMTIATLDVSAAFLHSDLPSDVHVVIRMPSDLSWSPQEYKPVYSELTKALNGLRCASRAWINTVRDVAREHGVYASPTEPCVFHGDFCGKGIDKDCRFYVIMICYVDDVLVASLDPRAPECIQRMLKQRVAKAKITGLLKPGLGGSLKFLGRQVARFSDSPGRLVLRVPPDYLYDLVKDLKGTDVPPNLDGLLEQTASEKSPLLSESQAAEYRTRLGRLAWWVQSRPDFLRYVSLLATMCHCLRQASKSPPLHTRKPSTRFLSLPRAVCINSSVLPGMTQEALKHMQMRHGQQDLLADLRFSGMDQ